MNIADKKAFINKTFATAKQAHDDAVAGGAKCGSQCAIFHKSASGKTKSQRSRAYGFLLQLDREI